MTKGQQITMLIFAAVGAANIILPMIFRSGRWSQKTETGPAVLLERLSGEIKNLTEKIADLKNLIEGRYATLEGRQLQDHKILRDFLDEFNPWKMKIEMQIAELKKEYEDLECRVKMRRESDRAAAS